MKKGKITAKCMEIQAKRTILQNNKHAMEQAFFIRKAQKCKPKTPFTSTGSNGGESPPRQ